MLPDGIKFRYSTATNFDWLANVDTSNIINGSWLFADSSNLVEIAQFDTSNMTTMSQMFKSCIALISIPLLDTGNVENTVAMFNGCNHLISLPTLDLNKVTNMQLMFAGCTALSNESLNNILAMCIGAPSYTGTKTLKYIGLTQTQATTCQTLSNWDAFVEAGWSTGY